VKTAQPTVDDEVPPLRVARDTQKNPGKLMLMKCGLSFTAHAALGAMIVLLFTGLAQGQPGDVWWNQIRSC